LPTLLDIMSLVSLRHALTMHDSRHRLTDCDFPARPPRRRKTSLTSRGRKKRRWRRRLVAFGPEGILAIVLADGDHRKGIRAGRADFCIWGWSRAVAHCWIPRSIEAAVVLRTAPRLRRERVAC